MNKGGEREKVRRTEEEKEGVRVDQRKRAGRKNAGGGRDVEPPSL